MWPPRIIAKESADEKNAAPGMTVTVSLPGVDEVGVDLAFGGIRPHAEDAVLGLEDDVHALRDEVRDEGRHADPEVHVHPVAELLGRAPDDAVPVELRHRLSPSARCAARCA